MPSLRIHWLVLYIWLTARYGDSEWRNCYVENRSEGIINSCHIHLLYLQLNLLVRIHLLNILPPN